MTNGNAEHRPGQPNLHRLPAVNAAPPLIRAPEGARSIFLVTMAAACGPLLAGIVFFGWRAALVTGVSVGCCAIIERLYYRVTRVPALLGRSHAYLTGLLLALTLPASVPLYVPLIAAAFAVVVGKAIFGGVGNFLWQPALVGRLAVAVMFPAATNPAAWPLLAQNKLLVGDITVARPAPDYRQWRNTPAPQDADAFLLRPPTDILNGLTGAETPAFSALANPPRQIPRAKPAALMKLPPVNDLIFGARPGGIGETSAVIIVVSGLYLIYRNYVKWQLPVSMLLAAGLVAAAAPIKLAGAGEATKLVFWPVLAEGLDVGFTYVNYQLLSGELLLAVFFLAPEMTSRPVTTGGQVIFGAACGAIGMLLQLYMALPIPFYMAVLGMNTLTPAIDAAWRPRVLGQRTLAWVFRGWPRQGPDKTE